MFVLLLLSQSVINVNSYGGFALSLFLFLYVVYNQLFNVKLQVTVVGFKDLRSVMGEGGGFELGFVNVKWLKEGQNQFRRVVTVYRDQNRNVILILAEEVSQEFEMVFLGFKGLMYLYFELEFFIYNAVNRGFRGFGLIISI